MSASNLSSCVHRRLAEEIARHEKAKSEGFKEPLVYQITRKDGKRRWLRGTGFLYGGGEVWVAEDITDTVIAQEKFRTVFEVSMVREGE